MKKLQLTLLLILTSVCFVFAQTTEIYTLLKPDRVFDGEQIHSGWVVLVKGNYIEAAGDVSNVKAPASAKVIVKSKRIPHRTTHQLANRLAELFPFDVP